jgi:hypothetical protein
MDGRGNILDPLSFLLIKKNLANMLITNQFSRHHMDEQEFLSKLGNHAQSHLLRGTPGRRVSAEVSASFNGYGYEHLLDQVLPLIESHPEVDCRQRKKEK